jgi:hypothetical protein
MVTCWRKVVIMRNCTQLISGTSRWNIGRSEGWFFVGQGEDKTAIVFLCS